MNKSTRRIIRGRLAVAAAVLVLPAFLAAPNAAAQQQVGGNGTALDANNRIGSGGVNTYRALPTNGNDIIYGNVTQGRAFHGSVPYSDPNAFQGFTAGRAIEDFNKNSVGTGVPYSPTSLPNVSTPYYSVNRFAPPPPGAGPLTTTPNSAGYIPEQPTVVLQNDTRLGVRLDAVAVQGDLPKPGELVLPGPVDPTSNQRTIFTASPLTGVRSWNDSDVNTLNYLSQFTGMRPENVLDRLQMSQNDLLKMRNELRTASGVEGKGPLNASASSVNAQGPNAPQQGVLAQPLGAPDNPMLSTGPIDASLASNALISGTETPESVYNRVLGEPARQSKTYDELQKRLARYVELQKSPAEVSAEAYTRAKRDAAVAAEKTTKQMTPVVGEGANKQPGATKPPPVVVKSMTEGVRAPGLKDLLGKAEAQMKEGKFTSAIDTYSAAEQVVPNQPLIWMGRANAELGAAYYGRAEAHLKQAFNSDKALLMGQYDLRSFLGEDRLKSVVKDLQEIARSDQQSATPVFLLAYISYNTGNESRAAGYLDVADKRSGGKDPIYKLLRDYWSLPPGTATPEISK